MNNLEEKLAKQSMALLSERISAIIKELNRIKESTVMLEETIDEQQIVIAELQEALIRERKRR